MAVFIPSGPLASAGSPGRIIGQPEGAPPIDIQFDVIESIERSSSFERTTTALETGESLTKHRIRNAEGMTWRVLASDVEPIVGSRLIGLWEANHAIKTRDRVLAAQAADCEFQCFDGQEFMRTPAGGTVWVIDNVDYSMEAGEKGVFRATIKFGESPRFTTQFTAGVAAVAPELADVTGSPAERGRQSATAAGDGGDIAGSAWP